MHIWYLVFPICLYERAFFSLHKRKCLVTIFESKCIVYGRPHSLSSTIFAIAYKWNPQPSSPSLLPRNSFRGLVHFIRDYFQNVSLRNSHCLLGGPSPSLAVSRQSSTVQSWDLWPMPAPPASRGIHQRGLFWGVVWGRKGEAHISKLIFHSCCRYGS